MVFYVLDEVKEFTRLFSGCINAAPIIQKARDKFISDSDVNKTHAYIDNIIICGLTLSEQENLANFMKAAKSCCVQFNKEKCRISLEIRSWAR